MDRQPVDSSNLNSVGYSAETETLEIQFRHGGVYEYFEVPPAVHVGLLQAPPLGRTSSATFGTPIATVV